MTRSAFNSRPNILVFFTDQQRWDTCGCYGQPLDTTPHLDQLAKEGSLFENAFTCQPVCGPARACLQTGKYASEVNCPTNNRMLPIHEDTIAKQLRRLGYETAYIGKWHLASQPSPDGSENFQTRPVPRERRGGYEDFWLASDVLEFTSHSYDGYMFDTEGKKRDFPPNRYRVDVLTDWAIEYLENRKQNRPFFLFLSYLEPHHQNDHNRYEGPYGAKKRFKDFVVPGDLEGTQGDWRENYPDYLGAVHSLDENLGRLLECLEKLGQKENTLIIFTSDHGSHFRTRNQEYKRSCHDGCTHIPLVIWGPGFWTQKRYPEMVSLIDIPPTIMAAAGQKENPSMRGRPLQELTGTLPLNHPWPDDVFIQISESHCGRAIRTHQWKYSVRAIGEAPFHLYATCYIEDFLYDLSKDPYERNNLVHDPNYREIRETMKNRLLRYMNWIGEPPAEILPATSTPL